LSNLPASSETRGVSVLDRATLLLPWSSSSRMTYAPPTSGGGTEIDGSLRNDNGARMTHHSSSSHRTDSGFLGIPRKNIRMHFLQPLHQKCTDADAWVLFRTLAHLCDKSAVCWRSNPRSFPRHHLTTQNVSFFQSLPSPIPATTGLVEREKEALGSAPRLVSLDSIHTSPGVVREATTHAFNDGGRVLSTQSVNNISGADCTGDRFATLKSKTNVLPHTHPQRV
jgi:hypothetical protein